MLSYQHLHHQHSCSSEPVSCQKRKHGGSRNWTYANALNTSGTARTVLETVAERIFKSFMGAAQPDTQSGQISAKRWRCCNYKDRKQESWELATGGIRQNLSREGRNHPRSSTRDSKWHVRKACSAPVPLWAKLWPGLWDTYRHSHSRSEPKRTSVQAKTGCCNCCQSPNPGPSWGWTMNYSSFFAELQNCELDLNVWFMENFFI